MLQHLWTYITLALISWDRILAVDTADLEKDKNEFAADLLKKYFPFQAYTWSYPGLNELEKRSKIIDSIRNFNENSEGALVVVNFDEETETESDKKSHVLSRLKLDDGGYSIVINDNGKDENEQKKNEIYNEMETDYNIMEKKFGEVINPPAVTSHKRVRVILITPKDFKGDQRDKLPQDPSNLLSLDDVTEVTRGNLILSENDIEDSSQTLSDSRRKNELEIDIDKLKNVKEKLKLLNEDEDPGQVLQIVKAPHKTLKNEAPDESGISSEDNSAIEATTHEIKKILVNKTASSPKLKLENITGLLEHARNISYHEISSKNSTQSFKDEHEKKLNNNNNSERAVNFNGLSERNTTSNDKLKSTASQKIDDDTDDIHNRKHEMDNKLLSENNQDKPNKQDKVYILVPKNKTKVVKIVHDQKVKPPSNPSPDETADSVSKDEPKKTRLSNENPTKSSSIKEVAGAAFSKKEKPNEHQTETPSDPTSNPSNRSMKKLKLVSIPDYIGKSSVENKLDTKSKKEEADSTKSKKTEEAKHTPTKRPSPAHSPTPARIIDKQKAEAIIEFMNRDPLESWRYHFKTLKSLDLNSTILRSGLVNAGNIERLKGVMRRALEGKDITLSVVGGSISAGGGLYKDRGNIDGIYYKGVVDWWNKMISPLTGSDMMINNIAIGSIGTDYFSYCVKNHVLNGTDIILWELSGNDYNRYKTQPTKGARPLETLTRMILELPKKPALLYVNFFKGIDYKTSRVSCPNFEDQGEDIIAHYYKIPSLSWRAMVCAGLIRKDPGYTMDTLFSQDQYHPSLRGHAQMSLLLLLHLRHVMRAVLQYAISHEGKIEHFENNVDLPVPLFIGPIKPEPLCWTLITADLNDRITNSLEVKVLINTGFKMEYATNFPIRFDKVICWKAEAPGAHLGLQFEVPERYVATNTPRARSELAVTTHTRFGGTATLWVDDKGDKAITIQEGRPGDPGKRTQVDVITNDLGPGKHVLNVQSQDGGFCLSAIMVGS